MRFGAHVPTRGRLSRALDYAASVGAEAIQLFISNPRAWSPPPARDDVVAEFRERRAAAGLSWVDVHASYMVNIASPDPDFLRRSVDLALRELEAAEELGADALVVHAGAGGTGERGPALERAAAAALLLAENAGQTRLLLELTAGGLGSVASTIPQARALLDALGRHDRVGLCLDTCHLLAAGYPLDHPASATAPFDEAERAGISDRIHLLHANDSRDARGSRRDRHAHVGDGTIGEAGFAAILGHEVVRRLPILIETPGHEEEDRRNLATLRRLAAV